MSPDWIELLQLLRKNNAKYLVIDGYAVMHYAEPRYTKDLDILVGASEENSQNVFNALTEFGIESPNLNNKTFTEEEFFYKIGAPPFRIDIITTTGKTSFEDLFERRNIDSYKGVEINFVSKEDLIILKRNAGRPIDKIDLEILENES